MSYFSTDRKLHPNTLLTLRFCEHVESLKTLLQEVERVLDEKKLAIPKTDIAEYRRRLAQIIRQERQKRYNAIGFESRQEPGQEPEKE